MLEEATPRAQLHIQRILGEFREPPNGSTGTIAPTTLRSPPIRHVLPASCPNFMGSSTGSSAQRVDSRDRHLAGNSIPHRSSNSSVRAAQVKGNGPSPGRKIAAAPTRVKSTRSLLDPSEVSLESDLPRPETQMQGVSQKIQRLAGVPEGSSLLVHEVGLNGMMGEDAVTGTNSINSATSIKCCIRQLEDDETFYRRFICNTADACIEMLRRVICYGEEAVKQLREVTDMVVGVSRFVNISAEEVLQTPEEHLSRAFNPGLKGPLMDVKGALDKLQQMPAILVANYDQLVSKNPGVCETQDSARIFSSPQLNLQKTPQTPQQQILSPRDANFYVRRPSSLFSRCGSLQAMSSRSHQPIIGITNPHAGFLVGESLESEEVPFSTTTGANMVHSQRERDADPLWAMEDLREENVYWQEEALRAVLEAEKYSQMLHTVVGFPPSSPFNGNSELGSRRISITAMGSPTQMIVVQRLFIRLLEEKEEGDRSRIQSWEAQEWWGLWFSARNAVKKHH
ncbi:hypothetical protein C3747_2g631 [Trypanosoma cruzi]|uniref:Uncharacterized protein n=2 Tax=Trypanosoma cruzi TaxID=5693 RepID=Q4D5B8_TRYCC|nr:hypothetical protein Tc00.1047053509803.10 [Trypanosoma cruzi]EAN87717.1 hypothetical protein Tc00.1047053509803.10 [Trypanosoma cruzi]PWV21416.1 hypothetical protein C3747_2g631 [Trypanosoma cruzi]RNC59923.1 hypothetical protein TcCL_ESM02373 [Trypanosoma cruzi]|eukprot:XP_809568.1 hypothetical protein [Trypanosoma cruzi strain CL Brener]